MTNITTETIVVGHRNPDTDSIAAAYALAELKKAQQVPNVRPVCIGLPGERTEYLFKRFAVPLPSTRNDVYPRVRNIMNPDPPFVRQGNSLLDAIGILERKHISRLPVVDDQHRFSGMLSLFSLLGSLLQTADAGLTGRKVRSSLRLIKEVLQGEPLSFFREDEEQIFEVYVAAMNVESFKEHIPRENSQALAIVVGDRTDIHLMSINMNARLMIITGSREVDTVVLSAARERGLSILKTPFDSATVVRRLKLCCPVELMMQEESETFLPDDRLCDIKRQVMARHEDIFPVLNADGRLVGSFSKLNMDNDESCHLILVDHNEFDQSIGGVEEVPVIEVIDHHRLSMPPTHNPVRITCDIVGSTCTLVTERYLNDKVAIPPQTAGILLGGIITDTLLLRSPTSTARDRMAVEYLQGIAGVEAETLMAEIFRVGSLIARSNTAAEIIDADRKSFTEGNYTFAISQVEEVAFEQFYSREKDILQAMREAAEADKLDFFGLLVTNVVREDSLLLAVGHRDILSSLPYRKIHDNLYDLPGILSRKKQLLPQLLKIISGL